MASGATAHPRVALATRAPAGTGPAEDRALERALWQAGMAATCVAWDDDALDWAAFDAVWIRSCWDYHLRLGPFLRWVEVVEAAGVPLWNPAAVVRWNADKRYLEDLAAVGVPVVPTQRVARGSAVDLAEVLAAAGWDRAVVKPSVSATAYRTAIVSAQGGAGDQRLLDAILGDAEALIQPFMPAVVEGGEWSFVYLADPTGCGASGGLQFSHAVRKRPRPGDYRVQTDFGGTVHLDPPPPGVRARVDDVARAVAAVAPGPLRYARVDGVEADGAIVVMEVELIEPYLFLEEVPGALQRAVAQATAALTR